MNKPEVQALSAKWEFLRRWPKYRADFKNQKKFPQDYWRKQYGIISPVDPASPSYSWSVRALFWPDPSIVVVNAKDSKLTYLDTERETSLENDPSLDVNKIHTLVIEVNIRDKRERILKDFSEKVILYQKAMKIDYRARQRSRYKDYEAYLRIYDLIIENGMPVAKVAKTEKHFKNYAPDEAKKKVRRYLARAKELVAGGYRQIET